MAKFEVRGIALNVPGKWLTPGLQQQLEDGTYEWAEWRALPDVLRPQDRLLDLGSAVGFVACSAAQTLLSQQITCVEANPDLERFLKRNLSQNRAGEATVLHGAVVSDAHEGAQATFELCPAFYSSRLLGDKPHESGTAVQVPALRFSDLLRTYCPDVITMDLEGAEAALATQVWPGQVRAVIMEIHTKFYGLATVDAIFSGMARNGFAFQPKGSRGDVVVFQRIGTE